MKREIFQLNTTNILIFFIIISFFLGFFFNENSAGGGNIEELKYQWGNYTIFIYNDFLTAINLTKGGSDQFGISYGSSRTPLIPILQAFFISLFKGNISLVFNPNELFFFRFVNTIISCFVPLIFFICLKKKFYYLENNKLLLLSLSVVFLSPYFRTSAFWGYTENYTFIFMLLTYLFYFSITNKKNNNLLNIKLFFLAFFSSLCVYSDVKASIIPLICLIALLKSSIDLKKKLFLSFYYIIFSIPFLYLLKIWGGPIPTFSVQGRQLYSFFFDNVGYACSIIFFYLIPIFFFKKKNFLKAFNKKKLLIFLLLSFFLVFFLFIFGFKNQIDLGKGIFDKLFKIFFKNDEIRKFFLYFLFIISIFTIVNYIDYLSDALIVVYFCLIHFISLWIFQEYFDPIILILSFTFFQTKLKISSKLIYTLTIYQSFFLISCILYYNKNIFFNL